MTFTDLLRKAAAYIMTQHPRPVYDGHFLDELLLDSSELHEMTTARPSDQFGDHLAILNLWRGKDGGLYLTVQGAGGAVREFNADSERPNRKPHDYVMELVRNAVERKE